MGQISCMGTSNLGTENLSTDKRSIGFVQSAMPDYQEARQLVMHKVKKFFKPEFLNRLDDIIVFHYLEKEHVQQIARMFVNELIQRMQSQEIELEVDDEVITKFARDGFDPVYGARPLRREVEHQVENPLAMKIVKGECPSHSRVKIRMVDNNIRFDIVECFDNEHSFHT
jgi:ATP-dependent Clp protease ATP-binding subunit ClpC